MPGAPTPPHPCSAPQTSGTAGCNQVAPSAAARCAPCTAPAAARPAAASPARSTAARSPRRVAQIPATTPSARHPRSRESSATDVLAALAAPAKCSCTSLPAVDLLRARYPPEISSTCACSLSCHSVPDFFSNLLKHGLRTGNKKGTDRGPSAVLRLKRRPLQWRVGAARKEEVIKWLRQLARCNRKSRLDQQNY